MRNSDLYNISIKAILLAIGTIAIYTAIYFLVYSESIQPSINYFYYDIQNCFNGKGNADVLIIGNSKAIASLSSKSFKAETGLDTYNIAYRGANIEFTRDLLIKYINTNSKKPSACILEVSWFTFSNRRTIYPENPSILIRLGNKNKVLEDMINQDGVKLIKSTIVRFRNLFNNTQLRYIDWWDGDPKNQDIIDPSKFNIKEMENIYPNLEAGIEEFLVTCFDDIINICKANDIKLILYTAPELPAYTHAQKDRNNVKEVILDLAKKYNLKYYDFTVDSKLYDKSLDLLLYNSHHVLKTDDFTSMFIKVTSSHGTIFKSI